MKTKHNLLVAGMFLAATSSALATVRYVWQSSPSPAPPYTNWATAAVTIQQAVDAAVAGDEIVVTNGIYATGGRTVGTNLLVNRVAVDKPLTVRSLNGPTSTIIQGYQVPGITNGDGAVRCVYLANGASLSGFTLTNGATRTDGDFELEDCGGGLYCESTNAVVSNCIMIGNSAGNEGGGSYNGTLNNCTLKANSARVGGGGGRSALNNCTLTGNSSNDLYGIGGGAYEGILNNCSLTDNAASAWGGGAVGGSLNNCTVTGNSAGSFGGGVAGSWWDATTLNNCIVYFNIAPNGTNYADETTLNHCCTTPMPTNGVGNITLDPQLASASHLSVFSPCRGAGSAAYATGTDIDGEPWGSPPSIGCDECHAGAVTGPLSVAISAAYTNVAVGFPVGLTAMVEGRTTMSIWEFGDGGVALDRPYETHAWAEPGDYVVALWAFNDSYPEGVSAAVTVHVVVQPVHYVTAGSSNPAPPYTSWTTAATNIQDAVDAGIPGALVLVTNGVYATGGRAVGANVLANRVAVDKPLTLRSVNGPQFTVIQGYQVPGSTNGDGAIRCVYLANGASLSGFTLTNGASGTNWDYSLDQSGGGVWCESTSAVVTNCVLVGNSASQYGGGAYGGTVDRCTFTGNSAYGGGGASGSTLNNCTLAGNSAGDTGGGGAYQGTLNNCTLTGNGASWGGGGALGSTLNYCALIGNSAPEGGGAYGASLNNCKLTGNSATYYYGGGAEGGALNNCILTGNRANYYGGGAYQSTLNNCTVVGNSAGGSGGGASGTLNNCIVLYNTAPQGANYELESTLNYCCTTPLPAGGAGNISLDPQLASLSHLSATSPCLRAGSAAYAAGTDIDGEAWANPPSIGCDEYHAGAVTGPLTVSIMADSTNVAVGFTVQLTALIEGRTAASAWDFGDGVVVSNMPYATHAWTTPGDYAVLLRAYNESYPEGVSATVGVHVVAQPVHYVAAGSAHPQPPYTSWATAAPKIQDAVDAATVAGALVLVTDGTYAAGGRVAGTNVGVNRVAVDKPLAVRSVNGPQVTVIDGGNSVRCVYLASGASLSGFTLTRGSSYEGSDYGGEGGGLYCESSAVASNCVVVGNSASWCGGGACGGTLNNCTLTANSAYHGGGGVCGANLNNSTLTGNSTVELYGCGGGAWDCILNNCTLVGNSAGGSGGGAYWATLNNCTLTGNAASQDCGGAGDSILNNCIVYYNTATQEADCGRYSTLSYCCTRPQGAGSLGNITNAPLFVDYAGGNLRLQSNSPCINAGLNAYAPGPTDLDGLPRIVGGTVDMGAYEFQGPGSVISYAWLQQYGLPTDGSADFTDPDRDGMNNWQEWRCGTDPTNASSALRLLAVSPTGTNNNVTWQSVAGVSYFLERSTNLSSSPLFKPLATGIPGQPGTTAYTDTNAVGTGPYFYRVGVGN